MITLVPFSVLYKYRFTQYPIFGFRNIMTNIDVSKTNFVFTSVILSFKSTEPTGDDKLLNDLFWSVN